MPTVAIQLLVASSLLAGAQDNPAKAVAEKTEKDFAAVVTKLQKELTIKFNEAIDRASTKGELASVTRLMNERDSFSSNERALPSHPAMKSARLSFETGWWAAKAQRESTLSAQVREFTKQKKLDEAKQLQAVLDDIRNVRFLPLDVADTLPGTWRVSFKGRTNSGSNMDYKASWEFSEDGSVRSLDTNSGDVGKWSYDYRRQRIVINWDNKDKSQEVFPLPLNPDGLTGETWNGKGVKFTASKVK
jgi:hypothetical protein